MAVREECRHYIQRSTAAGDNLQRCRVEANLDRPFDCPDGCIFFEERSLSGAGWTTAPQTRMSNTADALAALPDQPKSRRKGRKKRR